MTLGPKKPHKAYLELIGLAKTLVFYIGTVPTKCDQFATLPPKKNLKICEDIQLA